MHNAELRVAGTMLTVGWEKDRAGNWYAFETNILDGVWGSGVCVVWCEGSTPTILCVGHGNLPERLHEFCEDRAVTMYKKLGALKCTWAELPANQQKGVARYLNETLKPVFEDAVALVPSIEVNLPE